MPDYITRIDRPTWYTQRGAKLLELNRNTASPSCDNWTAAELRMLATACIEAADELDRRAALAESEKHAEVAT